MADFPWVDWHLAYDEPDSPLSHRLEIVRHRILQALDRQPDGPIRVVSMCAGQGRDLIGSLEDHRRRDDVSARLVELDPRIAETARAATDAAGLRSVEPVVADAGVTDSYAGAVPGNLVLACGVFGNITDADIARTIRTLPQLCAAGATVIWTRHRREPDLTPTIRQWFVNAGFEELSFDAPDESFYTVGVNRFRGEPAALGRATRFFTFVGFEALKP